MTVPDVSDFVVAVKLNKVLTPYPTVIKLVPLQIMKADSDGANAFEVAASKSSLDVVVMLTTPVPLFLNRQNQLLPKVLASGRVTVVVPPDEGHSNTCALSAPLKTYEAVKLVTGWL